MTKISHNKKPAPRNANSTNSTRAPRNANATSSTAAPRNANAVSSQLAPVPIAPGTFYEPVSQFDSDIVNANPLARHALSAATASKDAMAAAQLAARGDFAGAAASTMGFWQAMVGVVAPF